MKKRVLSLLLAFTLCLTLLPTSVFAADEDGSISDGVIGSGETSGEGGGIYVPPGGPTEGGGGTYIPGEDTRTEIQRDTTSWTKISRSYDGTTDGSTVKLLLKFTDGTNEIELKEGTDFKAVKTFDSADAGENHTVTVTITLIGDAAKQYKLKAGEETFTIGGTINKAYPDLTVSLSKATCTVGEKLLPLLSVSGVQEDAAVTYYYTQYKTIAGDSEFEDSDAVPKINENTAISETGTYYVYAKAGEAKNYNAGISNVLEFTVAEKVDPVVSVTAADGTQTDYASLPAALNAAQNGDTVRLLADATLSKDGMDIEKSLTLDLNGYALGSNGSLTVKSGAALTVTNAGGEKSEKPVKIGLYLTLLVEKGGSFTCTDGVLRYLGLLSAGTGDYTIRLADSENHCTFGGFAQGDETATVGDLLKATQGMALHAEDSGSDIQVARSTKINDLTYITCYVGSCSGHQIGDDGACIYCGSSYVASVTTNGGATVNYTSLDDALDAVKDGDTVTLQGDAVITKLHYHHVSFTLDLNGKTVTTQSKAPLFIFARTVVQDSSTSQTGKMVCGDPDTSLLNVQRDGDLIIKGGTFNGKVSAFSGQASTLTIEGGVFNGDVELHKTASISLSGGTFTSIWYTGDSFFDLLADGHAFFYTEGGNLVNLAEITGPYLRKVKIQEHKQHTFTDGVCDCGYTCPHTSVNASGACAVCGKQFAASVTAGEKVTYYDTFGSALVYATKNNGCTLKLMADVTGTTVMINNPFTFDLNGHNVDALSVDVKATIKDTGTTKGKIGMLSIQNTDPDAVAPTIVLGDLVTSGDSLKRDGKWLTAAQLFGTSANDVSVAATGITGVTANAPQSVIYGQTGTTPITLTVTPTDLEMLTFQWFELKDNKWSRIERTDGDAYHPANLDAGSHTIRCAVMSTAGFVLSDAVTVTVTKSSIAEADVTLVKSNLKYNGKAQRPEVEIVTMSSKTLTPGKDYYVDVTPQTDAGSYTLTVNGLGNYTGEIKKEWKIEPMKIDSVMISSDISKTYDGTAAVTKTPEEWAKVLTFKTLSASDIVDVPSTAYTISDASFVEKRDGECFDSPEAGEKYGITFKITLDSKNYILQNYFDEEPVTSKEYTQSGGANFTITQAVIDLSRVEFSQYIFNDLAKTYEIELNALLDEILSQQTNRNGCAYGDITYSAPSVNIKTAYYDMETGAKVKNGKLLLPIKAASTENGNIGTVTIEVSSTNYQTFELTLNIVAQDKIVPVLAEGNTVSATEITYGQTLADSKLTGKMVCPRTGNEVKGTFAWKNGTIKLNAGSRKAEWTFTPDAPEYTVVTGRVRVTVNPKSIEGAIVTLEDSFVYDGTEKEPKIISVVLDGVPLTGPGRDKDYGYSYNRTREVGTYYDDITIGGQNNYTGEIKLTWSITAREVTPTIEVASCSYTGDALEPTVTLKDDLGNTIDPKEYEVSYSNNTNAGTATVTVTDKEGGNYVLSEVSKTFEIGKAAAPTAEPGALTITNGLHKTYSLDLSTLLPKLDSPCDYGTVAYGRPVANLGIGSFVTLVNSKTGALTLEADRSGKDEGQFGTITVTVTTGNYQDITLTINVSAENKITPQADGAVTATDITYGQALNDSKITGKMKNGSETVAGTFIWADGTVKPDASDSYQATWKFTPSDAETYVEVTGKLTIKVNKAVQSATLSMENYTYGQTPSTPTLTDRTGDMDATVTYEYISADSSGTTELWDINNPPKLNAGTYKLCATIESTKNYAAFTTAYVEFTVRKATPTYTKPTGLTAKYGQTLADVPLPDGWSWMDSSESVGDVLTTAKKFMAKFNPADTANYNTEENIELDVTVNKANGNRLKTVESKQKYTDTSGHTYTPDWSGLPTGQTWSYSSEYSVSNGSIAKLTKQDVAVADGKLTYAISGGKAGDTVIITLKASCNNYEDFTITLTITLTEKDDQKALVITGADSVVYGQTLTLTTTGGSGTGAVTYHIDKTISTGEATIDPNTGVLTPVKVGSVSVIATKAGDNDYNDIASAPFVLMIKPATPAGKPKYTEITTGNKTLKDAALTIEGSTLNPNDGKLEWVDDKGNVLPDDTRVEANTIYKWRFTPTNTSYTTLTGEIELYHKSSSGGGGWCDSYYTIKATAGTGGSISPSGNVSVREGREQTFTITPDKGYAVSNVKIDGKSIGAVKSYTFENVTGSHTIDVIFVKGTASANTGDSSNLPLWSALLLASTLTLVGAAGYKRKRAR